MPRDEGGENACKLAHDDPSKLLGVTVGKHTVEPGMYIPRADAQQAPSLSWDAAAEDKTYLCVCLDLDAPFKSFNFLSPILHWTQSGFRKTTPGSSALASSDPFVCNWGPPGPPPGAAPHRYVFFLYEQPGDFDVKAHAPADGAELGIPQRVRNLLRDVEKRLGLGTVVAANYFTSN